MNKDVIPEIPNESVEEIDYMKLWLMLIDAETEEDLEELEKTNVKEIQDAIKVLREMSKDENLVKLAEMREKALHDEAMEKLKQKGMSEEEIKAFFED